jgi:hypothetical protein
LPVGVVSALGSAVRRPISWTVFIACLLSETVGLVPRELPPAEPVDCAGS